MHKKIYRFMISLKFAIILFLLIATYSIIGTILPQGLSSSYYIENYKNWSGIINFLQLGKVYSSNIFRFLNLLFIINLVGCTLKILPGQLKKMGEEYYPSEKKDAENLFTENLDLGIFKRKLLNKRYKILEKDSGFIASKHKIGNIGSSITHLGIVIILLGGFLGGLLDKEGYVNLLPGDVKAFEDKGFAIRVDDFYLDFREDGTIDQYYSEVSLIENNKEIKNETMWVNKPIKHKGVNFYQSSYGWASTVNFKEEDGSIVRACVLKNGDSCFYQPEHLNLYLFGFYPDLHIGSNGEPINMSEMKKNPYYAVVLYKFQEVIGSYVLQAGEPIEYEGLEISFTESKLYTGITYNMGYGYGFMITGSVFLLLGLLLSFYFYPKFIIVDDESITVSVRQNQWGFTQTIKRYLKSKDGEDESQWIS